MSVLFFGHACTHDARGTMVPSYVPSFEKVIFDGLTVHSRFSQCCGGTRTPIHEVLQASAWAAEPPLGPKARQGEQSKTKMFGRLVGYASDSVRGMVVASAHFFHSRAHRESLLRSTNCKVSMHSLAR